MMAWDAADCERMRQAARSQGKLLEIGCQRYCNPIDQAPYAGVVRAGVLGDVHYADSRGITMGTQVPS